MRNTRSKVFLNDPSDTAVEPAWARHHLESYEVASILLDLIRGQTRELGPVLHAMFNEDTERITNVLERDLAINFIQDMLYTEMGKGVLIGYILRVFEDEDYAAKLEKEEEEGAV